MGYWTSSSPSELVAALRSPSARLYAALKRRLAEPRAGAWTHQFLRLDGLAVLFDSLAALSERRLTSFTDAYIQVECVSAIRAVMDSRIGLDYIVENKEYTTKLAAALDTNNVTIKKQVFELLSALCVYNVDGYNRALDALEHYKALKGERYRFKVVVEELKAASTAEYNTALVAFINCIIISTPQLKDRIRIRNEFIGLKVLDVISKLRQDAVNDSDLAVQLDVFDEQRDTDEAQISGPDGVDLSSHVDVFYAILRQVVETPQEIPFLSVLQHLLRIDPKEPISDVIWDTAEKLLHRATLLEDARDSARLLRAPSHKSLTKLKVGDASRCLCSCHRDDPKSRKQSLNLSLNSGHQSLSTLTSPVSDPPPPPPPPPPGRRPLARRGLTRDGASCCTSG